MVKAIYLGAWHWGKTWRGAVDKGAMYSGFTERDIVIRITSKVEKILQSKAELKATNIFPVWITTNARSRTKVKYINNSIKMSGYNPNDCLYLDIHLNSARQKASWIEIFIKPKWDKADVKIATTILNRMIDYYPQYNRGIKSKLLNNNYCNARMFLVECGFICDEAFLNYAVNDTDRLAESICNGILSYIRSN